MTARAIEPVLPGRAGGAGDPGRRRRVVVRAVLAAGTPVVLAAAVLCAWQPWTDDVDRAHAGPTLAPASRAYPVLPDPFGDRYDAGLSARLIRQRQAFRQSVADVLQRHLPPGAAVAVSELSFGDYRVTVGGKEYRVVLYIDPSRTGGRLPEGAVPMAGELGPRLGADTYDPGCKPPAARPAGSGCVDGALPDGEFAAVHFPERTDLPVADPGKGGPFSSFRYRNGTVALGILAHEPSRTVAPITGEQWLGLVTDPSFVELVDYWRAHPELKGHGW
ncbi:hypothetical protein ACFZBU_15765 [Embleya sp. NPDC008237]|uniref:hypothetical protein n=1 Tax=Embleya sp. NPDC008237 TaxID=3363978 RepID=UPI0036F005E5